ncbi:MAG: type IX secretion system sortase PorU [Bacteroidota bacterium]|jgi:hypothetical protein
MVTTGLRTKWLLIVVFGLTVAPMFGSNKDVRILQADASGITLEYVPIFTAASVIRSNGFEFTRYGIEGGVNAPHLIPGPPEIEVRSFLLRFPGARNNSVEIVTVEYENIPNVLLPPVPAGRSVGGLFTTDYKMSTAAYLKNEFIPEQVAVLANIGETQGAILGELRVSPLRYNAGQRLLRKYTRIVVHVSFGSSERVTMRPGKMIRGLALNDEMFPRGTGEVRRSGASAFRNSVLATGEWFRFPVTADGMYKLTGQALLNAGVPSTANPHKIRIFGNGGYELPSDPTVPAVDDLLENAVYAFDANSNNLLDPDDYIVFYAKGTRGWHYDPASKTFSHYINHYSETNFYWLTYGSTPAKSMTPVPSLAQPPSVHPSTIVGKLFREDDKINILGSGLEWLGQSFNSGDAHPYVNPLPSIDAGQPVRYRFLLGAQSPDPSTFTVAEHGRQIVNQSYSGTDVGDDNSNQFISYESDVTLNSFPAADGQSLLRFIFSTPSQTGVGYIDWYEIFYRQFLVAQNNEFNFHSDDLSGVAEYDVSGFSDNQIFVFDVTRFDSVTMITNPTISVDTCSFRVLLSAGSVREFYAVGQSGFNVPGWLTRIAENQNLHGDSTQVDYVIITHPDFLAAAQRLQAFRQTQDSLRSAIVDVNQIYNEFGGGLLTPVAIRNYLKYIYPLRNPRLILLFGDGDYDYRRVLTTGPDWIPPWESEESFLPIESHASDDYFTIFDGSGRVKAGVGRLTARTADDANAMVSKIIEYETNPIMDPWKTRVTMVADDGPAGPGVNDGFVHTKQAEDVSGLVPSMFEVRKIYEYEYPTIYTAVGRRKPDVNAAIDNQINQGTLTLNFTGHGNPHLWAHEDVFDRDVDFPLLHNKQRYFFLVAVTCNFSYFDDVFEQSGGELLASMPEAGAVAVFAATRAVYSSYNSALNQTLYQNLFQVDSTGRISQQRLGDVVYRTKQVFADMINDRKYFLLGDPALRVSFPRLFATIDTLNRVPLSGVAQLKALSQDTVSATLQPYSPNSTYSGQAQLVVYDANRSVQLSDPDYGTFTFSEAGNILFRGEQTVNNGKVRASFVVPKDISYRDDLGRITLYFWNASGDGAGYSTNIRVGGSDSTAQADTRGPDISLYVDSRTFRPGDVVSASPVLIADLKDEHGINTSDAGVGHHIEAWVDNNPQSADLTAYYKSNVDTYREGTVQYQLNGLSEGGHSLRLRAWDTYNNPSVAQTTFDVVTGVGLRLSNLYNYPNPFASSTVFTFEHNQLVAVDAQVKIYTVAGRLIQSLRQTDDHQIVNISWDGRDRDGDVIANGVYLYKVIVKTVDGRFATEALGKLSVLR